MIKIKFKNCFSKFQCFSFSFEDSNLNKELPRPKIRKSKLVSENETSDFVSESKTSSGTFENFDNVERSILNLNYYLKIKFETFSSFLRQEDQLSSNQGSISEDVQFKPQVHWLHVRLKNFNQILFAFFLRENFGFPVKKKPKSKLKIV